MKIAPSILASDFSRMAEELKKIEAAGADWVHVDVMDGMFVPNITIGPPVIKCYRKHTRLPFDVHLMIVEPIRYLKAFADAGADYITVHVETAENETEMRCVLTEIKNLGVKAGLSIKPATAASAVFPYLDLLDLVLVMTVEPGFGNQKLIPSCLNKVGEIRKEARRLEKPIEISVDGGVNLQTLEAVQTSGVDVAVAGSAVFQAEDPQRVVALLKGKV